MSSVFCAYVWRQNSPLFTCLQHITSYRPLVCFVSKYRCGISIATVVGILTLHGFQIPAFYLIRLAPNLTYLLLHLAFKITFRFRLAQRVKMHWKLIIKFSQVPICRIRCQFDPIFSQILHPCVTLHPAWMPEMMEFSPLTSFFFSLSHSFASHFFFHY